MPKKFFLLFFVLSIADILFAQQQNNFLAVQIKTDKGIIEGNYDTKTGLQYYFGIPFAKPPIGDLRWKAPQPLDNWKGIKITKKFGPRPVQFDVFGDMKSRSDGLSEDCLYLNVWTSAKHDTKNLPVLVYFYGGGFVAGDASEPRYDGESMAKKGIVVVTANYRLNVFGFLALPELSKESPYKASGNYGMLDQVAALKWVQKNISAFGGDPKKVTIAGESAGSISVSLLMASPLSKDLMRGAIGESGAAIKPTLPPVPLAEAEKAGLDFAKKAGYLTLAELRKLSTREVYEIYNESKRFGFPLVIDGYFLPATLPEIFSEKKQAKIPLLVGWNSAEIPGTAFMQGQAFTEANFIEKIKKAYPKAYEKVLQLYPHSTAKEVERSATDLASENFITYSTWKWFDLQRKNSSAPVYRYLFSRIRPPLVNRNAIPGLAGGIQQKNKENKTPPLIGAPHASEIEYCMGNLYLVNDYAWTLEDFRVSKTMEDFFANFIINGNPNGAGLPEWNAAKPDDPSPDVMEINVESKDIQAPDDIRFELMDAEFKR